MSEPLDYSRVLYSGGYRHRSAKGLAALLLTVPMFAVGAWLVRQLVPLLFPLAVALFALAVVWQVWAMIDDYQRTFTIRSAGIENHRRFIPWSDVRSFAALGRPGKGRVTLFYVTGRELLVPRTLFSTRAIRAPEYEELLQKLRVELGEAYPNLELGGYYREEFGRKR